MTALTTPNQIQAFRLKTLQRGILLEQKGMKMTRGRSCLSIAKQELGMSRRAPAAWVLAALEEQIVALMA
jgi:hypothetical protein